MGMVLLDLQKAFDIVDHEFLCNNLDPIFTGLVTTVQVLYLLEICCLG